MPSSLAQGNYPFTVQHVQQEAAGTLTDRVIFIAPFECVLNAVAEAHSVAGSHASAVNLQLEKLTGTTAPGSGTVMLSNNTNAGFNLKGTANTVQNGAFKTGVSRKFNKGDRLATKKSGTTTDLAGVSLTLYFNRS